MSQTPRGDRLHIAILGRCNTGKSTVLNFLAGQKAAIVSERPGTTGDPVALAFELLPLGPVTFYDTAGVDEESQLGALRGEAAQKTLARADIAVLVTDEQGIGPHEERLMNDLRTRRTPFLLIFNKADLYADETASGTGGGKTPGKIRADWNRCEREAIPYRALSADRDTDPASVREALVSLAKQSPSREAQQPLLNDVLPKRATVVCVTPIDASAPKGRLIVPQVQVLRELVEHNHTVLLVQPSELKRTLDNLKTGPDLVVADSQAVHTVEGIVPEEMPLTTFSIIYARQKGDFRMLLEGAWALEKIRAGSPVLIAEACAHHAQDDDIARVKIPNLLRKFSKGEPEFGFCSGADFPSDLSRYALVIHCGGCMLNRREMQRRLDECATAGVPVTNFGMAVSRAQGVLERAVAPFAGK